MNTKILLSLACASLLCTTSFAQEPSQREGARARAFRPAPEQRDGRFARLRGRAHMRRELVRRHVAERLGITDEQKAEIRARVESAKPTVDAMRAEARQIVERARAEAKAGDRAGAKERARGELKALVERHRPAVRAEARQLVGKLTPEQRQKLHDAAAMRGRQLDDERLERGAARMLFRRAR